MEGNYYEELKQAVSEGMSLLQLIEVFKTVVSPAEGQEDYDLLFETGNYDFYGPEQLVISLTLQRPNEEDDEFIQLRMDILFPRMDIGSEEGNSVWSWEYDSYKEFFEELLKTCTFKKLKAENPEILKVIITEEET